MTTSAPVISIVPETWAIEVKDNLRPDEVVMHSVETDLNGRLQFKSGLLVVTNQRLLSRSPDAQTWESWDYHADLQMRHYDHAGVGHLELFNTNGLMAHWRFTLGQNLLVIRLMDGFKERQQEVVTGQAPAKVEQNICPSCKATLEPDQEECPVCTKVIHTPPSTWTLFRLWRFAHPYRFQLRDWVHLDVVGYSISHGAALFDEALNG